LGQVAIYLEAAKAIGLSTATLKQHMSSIRMLFDHLVTGGVLEHNPALSVKATADASACTPQHLRPA
jgi:site-specific recombinase XerC